MGIDAGVLNSRAVRSLCEMYLAEYTAQSPLQTRDALPSILSALGACAGFAAQTAVWRELILPGGKNPGDFLVYMRCNSGEIFFFGDAINRFLFEAPPDRLSFLSLAGASLSSASELPDIGELARHVAKTVGTESFGRSRLAPSVELSETPRVALNRTWSKAARILADHRPGEWPALLGSAANDIVQSNRNSVPPPIAVRILLEAAVPMSKLDPTTVIQSGIPAPSLTNWSMRALAPANNKAIVAEVRAAMPATPDRISAKPGSIGQPTIAFVNLAGTACDAMAAEDCSEIGSLFQGNGLTTSTPLPACDLLFLYCAFEPSGKIVGHETSLRDLIAQSGASVAVIASEVSPDLMRSTEFQTSLKGAGHPAANLVVTLNRNGTAFIRFYRSLFELMRTGLSMPVAWNELAPQGPQQHADLPGSICLVEAGQVVLFSNATPSDLVAPKAESAPRRRRTWRQRRNAVGVGAIVIGLIKFFTWLATPAPQPPLTLPANLQINPLVASSPPGPNSLHPTGPTIWGPIPKFPQAGTDRPNTSQ